jgi:lipoprotein-anchoring transpeptidase ErfK/SrfK
MKFLRAITVAALAAVAGFLAVTPASAEVVINVDKYSQRMTVSVDGVQRWRWPVSTGVCGHDTPSGSYTTFRMEKEHFSKEWDDAPMPHSIFFTMKGHAIHGSMHTKYLGRPASHGCVRIAPENAELLFKLVKKEGLLNTRVVLTGDAGPAAEYGSGERQRNFFEAVFGPPQDTRQDLESFDDVRKSRRKRGRDS